MKEKKFENKNFKEVFFRIYNGLCIGIEPIPKRPIPGKSQSDKYFNYALFFFISESLLSFSFIL